MSAIVSLVGSRRFCAHIVVAGLVLAVAGCAGTDKKEAKLRPSADAKSVVVTDQVEKAGAYKTPDGYPDLSRPLTAANNQMSNNDAKSLENTLTLLAQKRKSGLISESEYNRKVEEFRKLGQMQ